MAKKPIKLKKNVLSGSQKDLSVQKKGVALQGKRIALAIAGGIGATEAVKIAREIRRHGGSVKAFMSPQARRFITPLSLEWATLEKPVLKAGPKVEYLEKFDLVLVTPATLHTLSKSALALSDNVVDLVIANQLGSKGLVLMVLAMNTQLWSHPLVENYQKTLESWGVRFFPGEEEEDRLKVPEAKTLVEWLVGQID